MKDLLQKPEKKSSLRIGIIINLAALFYLIFTWSYKWDDRSQLWLLVSGGVALVILLFTYFTNFGLTGLWRYTHLRVKDLDERELVENNRALRFAYSIFGITVLLLLGYFAVSEIVPSIIPVVAMLYFAHILPGVYLGWTKAKENDNL